MNTDGTRKGFIILHRKLLDSPIWQNPTATRVFLWCLMRANFKPCKGLFNGSEREIPMGAFICGRHVGAEACGLRPSTFRDALQKLQTFGMVTLTSGQHSSIVHVTKWSEYQIPPHKSNTSKRHKRPTQEIDTSESAEGFANIADEASLPATPDSSDRLKRPTQKPVNNPTHENNIKTKSIRPENPLYTPDFEAFWALYPRKEAKAAAARVWANVSSTDRSVIMAAILVYPFSPDPQFVKLAAGWLRDRRWEDEPSTAPARRQNGIRMNTAAEAVKQDDYL